MRWAIRRGKSERDLNQAQRIAFQHPCRLAAETTHPRFRRRHLGGYTVVLTINYGYE